MTNDKAVHVDDKDISIDEQGRVIITNPALAKAIRDAKTRLGPEGRDKNVGCFDWKCR